jgi:hypothetical protein
MKRRSRFQSAIIIQPYDHISSLITLQPSPGLALIRIFPFTSIPPNMKIGFGMWVSPATTSSRWSPSIIDDLSLDDSFVVVWPIAFSPSLNDLPFLSVSVPEFAVFSFDLADAFTALAADGFREVD